MECWQPAVTLWLPSILRATAVAAEGHVSGKRAFEAPLRRRGASETARHDARRRHRV